MIGRWTKQAEPIRSFSADIAGYGQVAQRYVGTASVCVDSIIGSVGRAHELSSDFLPLRKTWGFSRENARYRWVKKAMSQAGMVDVDDVPSVSARFYSHDGYLAERGTTLPLVELYKLGNAYYVLDGHHRVAAARSLGQVEMDAVVTEYRPVQTSGAAGVAV